MMRPSERVRVGGRVALPIILHTPNATQLNCTEMINKKRIKIRSKLSPTREFALFSSSSTFARGNQTDVTTRTQRKNKRIKSEAATCCFDFSEEKKKKVSWGISWIETKEKKNCTVAGIVRLVRDFLCLKIQLCCAQSSGLQARLSELNVHTHPRELKGRAKRRWRM